MGPGDFRAQRWYVSCGMFWLDTEESYDKEWDLWALRAPTYESEKATRN